MPSAARLSTSAPARPMTCRRPDWDDRSWSTSATLERVRVGLAGPDPHGFFNGRHEDLAVADLSGLGRCNDGLDDFRDPVRRHRDLDPDLRQEIDGVFSAAVDLAMTLQVQAALI